MRARYGGRVHEEADTRVAAILSLRRVDGTCAHLAPGQIGLAAHKSKTGRPETSASCSRERTLRRLVRTIPAFSHAKTQLVINKLNDLIAGFAAVAAGLSWMAWALINSVTHRALETSTPGSNLIRLGITLTVAWNLLLVPAALRIRHWLTPVNKSLAVVLTGAGVLSSCLWAIGALTQITHSLEFVYLSLASAWLLSIAILMSPSHRSLARFTLVVGAFTALDALFNRFEPMPFILYILAAPKLPLNAIWSVAIGLSLLLSGRKNRRLRAA